MIDDNNNVNDNSSDDVDSISGNDSEVTGDTFELNEEENTENENYESQIYINNSIDYSSYFENLQTLGIFICGLLVAYGIAFAFFKGFKK